MYPAHWVELPDGHTRATTVDQPAERHNEQVEPRPPDPLSALLTDRPHALVQVAHRPLADYDALTSLTASGQEPTLQPTTPSMVGAA